MALHFVAYLHARYERAVRFLRNRFEREEYLGLHLTVGFLVSLGGLAAFSFIARSVVHQRALTRFDLSVYHWLGQHATLFGYGFWSVISALGGGSAIFVIGAGIGLLLVLRRHLLLLAGWAAALLGGAALDGALKVAFHRPRPETAADFLSRMSWSFPSGHSMGSLIAYGMMAYLLILEFAGSRRRRTGMVVAAACLVLAIGLSRLYLGVHYFSDVLGGFAAGGLWLSACISGLEVARRLKQKVTAPSTPGE